MRGSRVQAVVQELQGEKIDIIPWSSQAATFVVNALAPAEVTKVVLDEEAGRVEVVVPDEQLSLAIGRRGQNVRLASQLTRWDIDILTEAEESERRQEEFRRRSGLFVEALDVDDMIAGLLVTEGFTTVEELAFTPIEEVAAIEGFDESVAEELVRRAEGFLAQRDTELNDKRVELGVSDDVAVDRGPDAANAGGAGRERGEDPRRPGRPRLRRTDRDRRRDNMDEATANEVIMAARAHWFDGEERKPRRRRLVTTETDARRPCGCICGDDEDESRRPVRFAAASSRASGCRRSG